MFTDCPPGPDEQNVSMRRSLASILMSTSSASGSTATVIAEVCTRPCVSVAGTRCTRCTPLSHLSCEYTRSPSMIAITSLYPPTPDSESDSTSTFHRCCSAKRVYMRKTSAANSEASSPPVPARISRITFFSSLGSLGSSSNFSSSSSAAARGSSAAISSCAIARMSASLSASMLARFRQPFAHLLQLAILLHRRLNLAQRLGSLLVSARGRSAPRAARTATAFRCSAAPFVPGDRRSFCGSPSKAGRSVAFVND